MNSSPRILIVEDEALIALALKLELTRAGYPVIGIASRGEESITLAAELDPEVILMDIRLAGEMDGFAAAERIQAHKKIPIIFVSGYIDESNIGRAAEFAPLACLSKPVTIDRLKAALGRLDRAGVPSH